jgi:hypothetical protein
MLGDICHLSKFEFQHGFEYRYLEIDVHTGIATWEREPNRKADISSLVNSRLKLWMRTS